MAYDREKYLRRKARHPDRVLADAKRWRRAHLGYYRRKSREHFAKRKAAVDALKAGPCSDCRRCFPPECMDFDHVRGEKSFGIARGQSLAATLAEIAKCDLVCANCHRIRTVARRRARRAEM